MNAVAETELTLAAFEAGSVDPNTFDHESHVYVAWLYLRQYPLTAAIARFTGTLRRLTVELGAVDKYHETISWFFMLLIAERRASASSDSWVAFRHDNGDLFCRENDILTRYYSDELVWSDKARKTFVLPDKLAS